MIHSDRGAHRAPRSGSKPDDGNANHSGGLYTIFQEVLSKLPDAVVVKLFRRGYAPFIDEAERGWEVPPALSYLK